MNRIYLRGGLVVDGRSAAVRRADVLTAGERIVAVRDVGPRGALGDGRQSAPAGAERGVAGGAVADGAEADGAECTAADGALADGATTVIDCTGRLVVPGFVDAHSHVDGAVFRADVQLALLRQGVTTAIGGQDGVSYAPGDGRYATGYFGAINGPHPTYRGNGVADLLASYDGATPLNVAYLVPAGTVRHEVMGAASTPASRGEMVAMIEMVAQGIAEGAVGISTGLDYAPGLYADAAEIAALCGPVAAADLPYVTHMRGGYEDNAQVGVEEAAAIGQLAGVRVHLSHFHTRAAEAWRLMDVAAARGVAASFDAYPYTRGCTILGMPLLPPALNAMPVDDAVQELQDPAERTRLRREWFPRVAHNPSLGPHWPQMITIGHAAAPEFAWAQGKTLAQIAGARGTDPIEAALDLLVACRLEVNAIMAVRDQRPVADLGHLISHPQHVGGSDGIFIGAHPHPRASGTFASYLGTYVRDHGYLDWPAAVRHLSTHAAELFQLGERGRIEPGYVADLAVIDPAQVRDIATYADPTRPADGVADVIVAGQQVLAAGRLTGARPGRGLRAARPAPGAPSSSSAT